MKTFDKAFEDLVKDMYSAEKQVLKALPKAAKAASDPDLKSGFEEHRVQTEEHVARLEQVAETCGFKPSGKVCKAAQGLIEEMAEIITEEEEGPVKDAMLICGGQKFEHYEIANYGTAVTWARMLGKEDCAELLQMTLDEEKETDEKLTALAESVVNEEAVSGESRMQSTKGKVSVR
jgi:ferritin-like metal-binding protein YciE